MKMSRLLAVPAIAAAALMTMTGCFQLPGSTPTTDPGTTDPGTDPGTSEPATEEGGAVDLAGTSWTGSDAQTQIEMAFTLNADGTVDFSSWNGDAFDSPTDTWSVSGDQLTIYVSGIDTIGGITYTGTAATGSMTLSGTDDQGQSGYTISLTQS